METYKLYIGEVQTGSSGVTRDTTRVVEFEAEKLAENFQAGEGRDGGPTDTRGLEETLYRLADGRLLVHVKSWSHWQGEPTTYDLAEVSEADLSATGRYHALGAAAGMGRPLSVDEALVLNQYPEVEAL